jgi:hypothetical protein
LLLKIPSEAHVVLRSFGAGAAAPADIHETRYYRLRNSAGSSNMSTVCPGTVLI